MSFCQRKHDLEITQLDMLRYSDIIIKDNIQHCELTQLE